jgi:hypothetical protein
VRGAEQILIGLSHDLHAHPEVTWEEHRSADRVAAPLADAGFSIETNYLGLDPAFAARAGSGRCKVPQRTANPQPDAELAPPCPGLAWPGRKDQRGQQQWQGYRHPQGRE